PRPAPAGLRGNSRLRAFRARAPRVHLGADRPGGGLAVGGGLTPSALTQSGTGSGTERGTESGTEPGIEPDATPGGKPGADVGAEQLELPRAPEPSRPPRTPRRIAAHI